MAETVFAVFREGVYRHECGGIFSTPKAAIEAADALAAGEEDDYHRFDVVPFEVGVAGRQVGGGADPLELPEPNPIYTARKALP